MLQKGFENLNRVIVVVGTRPEIIKIDPVINGFEKHNVDFTLLHSAQHYDYDMSLRFFQELGLPMPDLTLRLRAESPVAQTATIMMQLEKIICKDSPMLMVVQGDTNTMLAAAITAFKHGIPVEHVEAGLRSYDWRMPEEHNRRMVDHASEILFAPTMKARLNLLEEDVPGRVYVTGNTIIDAIIKHIPIAEKISRVMNCIDFEEYALATAHRKENVDNPIVLRNLINSFIRSSIPIVFPIHPRTLKRTKEFGLWNKLNSSNNVQLLSPQGYFDFLMLMKNCKLIITDSGGIQEEATVPVIRKPVLVTRLRTERPEACEYGFARIVGLDENEIFNAIDETLNRDLSLPPNSPFGDGLAGNRIAQLTSEFFQNDLENRDDFLQRQSITPLSYKGR